MIDRVKEISDHLYGGGSSKTRNTGQDIAYLLTAIERLVEAAKKQHGSPLADVLIINDDGEFQWVDTVMPGDFVVLLEDGSRVLKVAP